MNLKTEKISSDFLIVIILLMALSGCLYTLPTTVYMNNKIMAICSLGILAFSRNTTIKLYSNNGAYGKYSFWFMGIVVLLAVYSILIHGQSPLEVFNISGGYFGLVAYTILMGLKLNKQNVEDLFVNFTKVLFFIYYIQYFIFKFTGNIVFVDFYNPQMRAGFLRAGIGSEFFAISIILLVSRFLVQYRKKKKFSFKILAWIAFFTIYFVLFICVRAEMLAIFLSCLILVFMGSDRRKIKLLVILSGIVGVFLIAQSSVFEKYMMIDKIEGGGSITGRLEMYEYYFKGFLDKPILGQGFLYPSTNALKILMYGRKGYYYLEDVGIVGFVFTFGFVGIMLLSYMVFKGFKNISALFKSHLLFDDPETLGLFVFFILTFPTLFMGDYARNGFFPFILFFMTPIIEESKND